MTIYPQVFRFENGVMVPLSPAMAARQYEDGETYRLEPREERSPSSHNHFFAAIHEAWQNLPEDLADHYPTPDHLRKRALIKCGYRNERAIVLDTPEDAQRIGAFAQEMDDLSYVTVNGNVVTIYTAKSQSQREMGKKAFQEYKTKVLDCIAQLIGVTADELKRNTGAAA